MKLPANLYNYFFILCLLGKTIIALTGSSTKKELINHQEYLALLSNGLDKIQ